MSKKRGKIKRRKGKGSWRIDVIETKYFHTLGGTDRSPVEILDVVYDVESATSFTVYRRRMPSYRIESEPMWDVVARERRLKTASGEKIKYLHLLEPVADDYDDDW